VTVHFIGAGPGAADLITLRARDLLAASPVCLYAGSLVPRAVLEHCPPGARLVDTADLTLEAIVAELADAHAAGLGVARLCSGDPSFFSAVAEQMRRLDALGIDYDVTPGVPAFAAAAASLKRELTVPGVAQAVVLARGRRRATPVPPGEDLPSLAKAFGKARSTLVLHLAVQLIDDVVADLVPEYGSDCPVAVVAYASRDDEIVLRGTLETIAAQVHAAGVRRTAVIVVGAALTAEVFPDSHLYGTRLKERVRTVEVRAPEVRAPAGSA
jgi:precorrin-4/cobalt-precorrin-4 C11-methyltransferase